MTSAPTSNPACEHQVYRHDIDGWLLKNPEMHLVFYGSYWTTYLNFVEEQYYQNAWHNLLDLGTVLQRLSEYGIASGTLDPIDRFTNYNADLNKDGSLITKQITIDDATFPTDINNDILAGILPQPNDNTLYVIMLPKNTTTKSLVANKWAGYHDHSVYAGNRYAYAIIGYNSTYDNTDELISHELLEASSNPDGSGYYEDNDGDEIADICQAYTENIDGYTVEKVFSDATCSCL
jgi:hypothetical protein